jgi:hypothetical protein
LGAEADCKSQKIMRGMNGSHLLSRFTGRLWKRLEHTAVAESGSDQAEGEAGESENGHLQTAERDEVSGCQVDLDLADSVTSETVTREAK